MRTVDLLRIVAVLALAVVPISACSDDETSSTTTTVSTSSSTTSETTVGVAPPGAHYKGDLEGTSSVSGTVSLQVLEDGQSVSLSLGLVLTDFSCGNPPWSGRTYGLSESFELEPDGSFDRSLSSPLGMAPDVQMDGQGTFESAERATGTVWGTIELPGSDPASTFRCEYGPLDWTATVVEEPDA